MAKKRNYDDPEDVEEEDYDDDEKPTTKKKAATPNKKAKKTADQDAIQLDLDKTRKITVRHFKGKTLIDIREFYTDKQTEEEKPGKKGIALSPECWNKLKEVMGQIDEAIESAK